MANNNGGDKSLESWIWDAACSIRGAKDAPKYKDYILPLIFTKRLCDVFDDELNRIAKEVGSRKKAFQLARADHKLVRFYLPLVPDDPEQPVWSVIRKLSDKIGEGVTTHMRAIARENPLLQGIIDRVDFNATTHGQRDLDDDRLSNLIEAISTKRLGLDDVEADIIGKSYEYLIRKFAEGGGQSAGEFYTPPEVGTIMSRVLQPEPGMEIYDPTCGSGGLLVKCEIAMEESARGQKAHRRPAETVRPGIHARDLGHGQHEHDHPRHGRPDRDRRHLQEPQIPQQRASSAPSTASSPIPCGTRTGSPRPTTTTTNSTASPPGPASPANPPPTGAGCSTCTPA
jgi:type I restriction-modification system DNA methylase subunit